MSFHGGSPCNARSLAQSLGRIALLSALPGPRHQDSTRPLMKPGVSTSLRRLFAPSAILKGDFECNRDITLTTFRRKNALSDIGRITFHATEVVFRGDFARVHSRARGKWTVPA